MTETPRWRGVNHLALVTNDMDATVRFWHGVLGAELVATIGTPEFRHYFFDIGVGTVAFFEYTDRPVSTFAKPAGIPDPRAIQFDHLSLDLDDEAALEALHDRLVEFGCEVTTTIDHGFIRSIYFTDPNGIALEASWWTKPVVRDVADAETRSSLFLDQNPVPAVVEAMAGTLRSTPRTTLVDEPTPAA
ncbi:MAG: VOC family protein [Acidimicrobiia bacterium]